jgi:ribosomal protein S18 acetylase RimI-like enzyme
MRTPLRRPESARPRSDREEPDDVAPPDEGELEQIERGLVRLAQLLGATVTNDPTLRLTLVRWPGHGPAFNQAALVRWPQKGWEPLLERLTVLFRRDEAYPAVVVAEGRTTPRDLAGRLVGLGWIRLITETVLWTRRARAVPHLDPSMRVESVTPRTVAEHEAVERAIFGLPPAEADGRAAALRVTLEAATQRAYLIRVGGEPVAAARLVPAEGAAALHGIGVVEAHRRKGYGTLATTIATRAALATGHRLVWLSVASDNAPALAMYEGLGFRPAFSWSLLCRP